MAPAAAQDLHQEASTPVAASTPEKQMLSDVSSKPDSTSPQLNPLAKSFVPGKVDTSEPQTTAFAVDAADTSSQADVQPSLSEEVIANGTTGPDSPITQNAEVPPSLASHAAAKIDVEKSSLESANHESSHMDAQGQRNKPPADRQVKLKLWNNLKLTAFTRTITSLYCVVLLTLQTHIQLNLIGRYAYLASVEALAREADDVYPDTSAQSSHGLDHDTERLYLTFSWWFLHHGWDRLSDRVSSAIERSFSPVSVKAQLSMADLRALLNDARYLIEHDSLSPSQSVGQPTRKRANFMDILFPNSIDQEVDILVGAGALDANDAHYALATNHKLRALLDETKDIIESPDFGSVLALCTDRVFETFFNSLNPTFDIPSTGKLNSTIHVQPLSAFESRFQEITEEMQHGKRVRLASLFPLVSRQSQMAIRGVPNEYIEALADSKELRAFSAVLYAAWSSL